MPIEVEIHEINIDHKECVLTIMDNGVTVVENVNIGLQLKEDGSADNDWIRNSVKRIVSEFRLKDQPPIVIHTTGE